MSLFSQKINEEMRRLSTLPRIMFYGQSVKYDGAAIYRSLEGVPMDLRVEMPVAEEFQMGFCIGASLAGVVPVCIYPRMDFMLLCLNQLVNHLDKLPLFGWRPKIIIRTTVGGKTPLDAGPQHTQNHVASFGKMLSSVEVIEVNTPEQIGKAYQHAANSMGSTLVVENPK